MIKISVKLNSFSILLFIMNLGKRKKKKKIVWGCLVLVRVWDIRLFLVDAIIGIFFGGRRGFSY